MSAGAGATQPVWLLQVSDRVSEALQHQLRRPVLGFRVCVFFHLFSRFYLFGVVLGLQITKQMIKRIPNPQPHPTGIFSR